MVFRFKVQDFAETEPQVQFGVRLEALCSNAEPKN
jgi:hypothetical protein